MYGGAPIITYSGYMLVSGYACYGGILYLVGWQSYKTQESIYLL